MNKLKQPIYYLQLILIILSIIALLLGTFEGFKMRLDISSTGFQNFLKLFTPYSILFTATFVVITAHLAIERLSIMNNANIMSYRASNRTIWIQTVKEFLTEIKSKDPYINKEITKQLITIHDYLFEKNYKLSNNIECKDFFDKFFSNRIQFYEQMNTKFLNIGYYIDKNHSYCWEALRYIIIVMLNADECYPNMVSDLQQFTQAEVIKFSNDHIDYNSYIFNLNEYAKRKRDGNDIK